MESLAHTKWNCKYHIVFIPKYRRKAIYGQILKKSLENEDYQNSKDLLLKIKKLANDFILPDDACQAYTRVYEAYKIIENKLTK